MKTTDTPKRHWIDRTRRAIEALRQELDLKGHSPNFAWLWNINAADLKELAELVEKIQAELIVREKELEVARNQELFQP